MQENQNSSQSESVPSDTPSPTTRSGSEKVSRKSQRKISRSSKSEVLATRKRTNPMVWLLILINTLVVAVLCTGAFYGWMQWQSLQTSQTEREASLKQEVTASVKQQISAFNTSASADMAALENKLAAQLASSDAALQDMTQQIEGLQSATATDWDQAELGYLVKMAQRKVNIEDDIKTAIRVLSEADVMLFEKHDDSYIPLREAIASDVQSLKAARLNSPVEAAIAMTGLVELSDKLIFPKPDAFYESNVYEMTSDTSDWWQNIKTVWRKMVDDFLTVEKLEDDIKPYLSEQQKQLVKGALRQSLLTARYALLKQEQTLFVAAVLEAQTLLRQFDANQSEVSVFAEELKTITEAPFPTKTDIVLSSPKVFTTLFEQAMAADKPKITSTQEAQSL